MDKELLLYNYFSNQLSEEDKWIFENLLETDSDFKAQFNFEKDLKRVIKDDKNQDLKMKLVEFEKEIKKQVPETKSTGRFRQWSFAASLAVLFGLGLIAYNTFLRTDYNDLYKTNFEQYPNTAYSITRGDTNESLERDAFAAYESGNFQKALDNFDRISELDKKPYFHFYKAQCYLNLGDTSKATELFKKIIGSGAEFEAEAQWYLALSYLKEKDKTNAIATLKKLVANQDYNKVKALELLKELD